MIHRVISVILVDDLVRFVGVVAFATGKSTIGHDVDQL